jgi:hypothetical protein
MVKTQLQAQTKASGKYSVGFQHDHRSTVAALVGIFKKRGVKGLWRGYSGLIPRTAVGGFINKSYGNIPATLCLFFFNFRFIGPTSHLF